MTFPTCATLFRFVQVRASARVWLTLCVNCVVEGDGEGEGECKGVVDLCASCAVEEGEREGVADVCKFCRGKSFSRPESRVLGHANHDTGNEQNHDTFGGRPRRSSLRSHEHFQNHQKGFSFVIISVFSTHHHTLVCHYVSRIAWFHLSMLKSLAP